MSTYSQATSPANVSRLGRMATEKMLEAAGQTTNDSFLENLEDTATLTQAIIDQRLPIQTEPPDSLDGYARQIWTDLLQAAGENHFFRAEVHMIEEYCWIKAQILIARNMMGSVATPDDMKILRSLQTTLIMLNRMLRLSGSQSEESVAAMKLRLRREYDAHKQSAKNPLDVGSVSDERRGLMYGHSG